MTKQKSPITDLVAALKEDEGYYRAWHESIAITFEEELRNQGYKIPCGYRIANQAATNFLNLLMRDRSND